MVAKNLKMRKREKKVCVYPRPPNLLAAVVIMFAGHSPGVGACLPSACVSH